MKIDIEEVVTRAKRRLKLMDTTRWDSELESLINEAAFHLDAIDTFIVSCETIDIECNEAKLPDGATQVIAFSFQGEGCSGCCHVNNDPVEGWDRNMACSCSSMYIFDRNVLTNFNGFGVSSCYAGNVFAVQSGYLKFPSTVTATEVKVWYRGYNMDGDGIMILDQRQIRGLSAYAAYEFALSNATKYTPFQIKEWQATWRNQKSWNKGVAAQEDFNNNKGKFAAIAKAILINPVQSLNANL
jgi:hypothetical protein